LLARALALRRFRRGLGAFLVSRPILTGAGTLDGRRFTLSEKAPSVRRAMRLGLDARARGMFDLADILKGAGRLFMLRWRIFLRAFARRQRLQMGCSDANMTQSAELLKVGTMLLLLDMLEAGALDDAPRPRDLVGALHAVAADPDLRARVALVDGREATALQLQRWYCDRARSWVAEAEVVSMETRRLLALWERVLDGLERDPSSLVGTLDWVTKRALVDGCEDLSEAALKKIDLRYHDIADGYLVELEAGGVAPTVVTAAEVDRARTEPPAGSPAEARSRLIGEILDGGEEGRVDWDYVRIGGWWRGRTIALR
jgi:proteasome accessory factor A